MTVPPKSHLVQVVVGKNPPAILAYVFRQPLINDTGIYLKNLMIKISSKATIPD